MTTFNSSSFPEVSVTDTTKAAGEHGPHLELYVSVGIMGLIIFLGVVGNSIVLYAYSRKIDQQTGNIFIIALAINDMIACLLVIPMTISMELTGFNAYDWICKIYYLVNSSGIPFSSMLMCSIAFDRFFCICHPFLRAITIFRAKVIVIILGAVAICLGFVTSFFAHTVSYTTSWDANGTTLVSMKYATFGSCKELNDIYKDIVENKFSTEIVVSRSTIQFYHLYQKAHITIFPICIIIVIGLYVWIYKSVLRMRRKRKMLKGVKKPKACSTCPPDLVDAVQPDVVLSDDDPEAMCLTSRDVNGTPGAAPDISVKRRRKSLKFVRDSDTIQNLKTAAMLFVVAVVFICTFLPASLMVNQIVKFNFIVFYLYYLAHATNPLIYCFMNRNFREDLRKIFCSGQNRSGRRATSATTCHEPAAPLSS